MKADPVYPVVMKTEFVKVGAQDEAKIRTAAKVLDEGGLVAFPTETVYGIGCPARREAIARLNAVKGRLSGKRYTLHVADVDSARKYVPQMPLRGRILISKAWPGPLTAVFEISQQVLDELSKVVDREAFELLYADGTVGIRCPDNQIAQRLLRSTNNPIVAPSANLSGAKPATTAGQVLRQFQGKIDMVLEGSEPACKYKKSSTVVKITQNKITVLRKGVYENSEIEAMAMVRILFVCTGNTCRSPMAAAFCRKIISEKLKCDVDETEKIGYIIHSTGVMGLSGTPASGEATKICAEKGLDIRSHHSSGISIEEIEASDFIFVMSKSHRDSVLELCPKAAGKCELLDGDREISDPIGAGDEVYRSCAKQIEKALDKRINEIIT